MYQSTGKPSVAKFRARLNRINECAATGLELAERWNPKGRNFKIQRDMIKFFKMTAELAEAFDAELARRASR